MPYFSTAKLAGIQLKAENIWKNSQLNASYVAEVEGIKAIKANQTAEIKPLSDQDKDYDVRVNWIDGSLIVATDLGTNRGNNCDLDGPQLDAAGKPYKLDMFAKTEYSINEDKLRTSIFDVAEVIAKGQLLALKALDEKVCRKVLARVDSFAGTNAFLGTFTASNGQTQVPAARYNAAFFAYLSQAAILNRMRNSFLLDNGTLYQAKVIADANGANSDGKGEANLFNSRSIYFDQFNMAAAGLTTDTLMIERGAVAFASRNQFDANPRELMGEVNQTRFSVPSPNIPGVRYDVYYTMKCVVNTDVNSPRLGEDEILHIWRFVAVFGALLNPEGPNGNTGVLAFNVNP